MTTEDTLARQRLEDHMKSCDARQAENGRRLATIESDMKGGFKDASEAVGRLHARIDKVLWTTLVGLAGVLIQLVLKFLGH